MSEWQLIAALWTVLLALIGVLYRLHDRRVKSLEEWREELPGELAMIYARKDSFERLEQALAANHSEHVRRLDNIDDRLLQVVEIALVVRGLKDELGNHDTGLRGQVHEQRRQLVQLAGKVPGGLEVFVKS